MAKTVVGMFDRFDQAQRLVQELVNNGFDRNDISLVANDSEGRYNEYSREVGGANDTAAEEGAGTGAIGGTVLGGALGLLVGLGALAIPGIGPVIAAGPLSAAIGSTTAAVGMAAAGAGIGAATGGLIGGLVGAGIPEEDANLYAEGVRRGGTLVMVTAPDNMADTAVDLMNRFGAVDIDDRSSDYRNEGWNRFDADAQPYTGEYSSDYYARNRSDSDEGFGEEWQDSSKAGTAGGTLAGAATGAAIGAAGGPAGSVIGGIAGAATGAGVGAAGDVAGENAEDSADADNTNYTGTGDSSMDARGADLGTNANRSATTRMGATGAEATNMGDVDTTRTSGANLRSNVEGEQVLPVVEEELRVGKRQVRRGGARIHTHVTETPVEENVSLRHEKVTVERRPANREISDADMAAFQEGTIEMTETAEEAIVDKQARVVEEVVLNKDVHEHQETIRDTVRRTDVDVEQLGRQESLSGERAVGSSNIATFDTYDNDFRTYYQSNLSGSGYTYDQYSPVFRYGYDLANDPRYGGEWSTVEGDARRYWEERNPGTWDRFKDSVRYAWERARGRT